MRKLLPSLALVCLLTALPLSACSNQNNDNENKNV